MAAFKQVPEVEEARASGRHCAPLPFNPGAPAASGLPERPVPATSALVLSPMTANPTPLRAALPSVVPAFLALHNTALLRRLCLCGPVHQTLVTSVVDGRRPAGLRQAAVDEPAARIATRSCCGVLCPTDINRTV